jgi:DNA-binding transcriptional LysR family regulator
VALVRQKLGAQWLESGRLVPLSDRPVPSPLRHYICWQPGTLERWECEAFVEWLVQTLS